jgi:hypothetical protein
MSGLAQDVEIRLAEIDRRLREIQADLVPGRIPRETRMPAARPPPPDPPDVAPRARAHRPPHPSFQPQTHGRSGPLADALANARRRRAQDVEQPPPERPRTEQRRPPPPQPQARPEPAAALLSELQSSLLAATRDLLDGYERAVSSASSARTHQVSLSAGPFSSTDSLRAFERALTRIPVVRDVAVRGYDGPDRAIIEVEIEQAAPPGPST